MNTDIYKSALLEEKAKIEKELSDIAVLNPENGDWEVVSANTDGDTADENDNADRFEDFEERGAILQALEGKWKEINTALSNIESGVFAKCTVCGKDIEEDRLSANPSAQTCKEHMES